jgi:hypothetical protein
VLRSAGAVRIEQRLDRSRREALGQWALSQGFTSDDDGHIYMAPYLNPGVVNATYWIDEDDDNTIDPGEMKSNSVITTVLMGAGT